MGDAVIYARYSSHNQRDASIEDQVRVCTEAAKHEGDRIVRVYADRARSGREATRRAEFLRMISDAERASWDRVYVYKYDRFARSRRDAAIYQAQLENSGVELVSATEPLSEGPAGILMAGVLSTLNEFFSANLSQNVRRGLEGNALQCKHNGAHLYGYDLGKDGYYHVNPEEAVVVRKAFEVFDAGGTTADVERALSGYRSRRGARFTKNRISEMLKNPKYAGTYVYREHVVPGGMEAIVDMETFERVNARLGRRHYRNHDYLLSGRLFDGEGRRFVGTSGTSRNGSTYHYYKVLDTGVSYPQADVEDAVCEAVADLLKADPEMVGAIADAVIDAQDEATAADREAADALRKRLAAIDRESANLVRSIAKLGPMDPLTDRLAELDRERTDASDELEELEINAPTLDRETVDAVLGLIMEAAAPPKVVSSFVSRVVLDGDTLTITFRISEPPEGSDYGRIDPETGEPPLETAGDGPRMAVRTRRLWLPNPDLVRTALLLVGPWGFDMVVPWRGSAAA